MATRPTLVPTIFVQDVDKNMEYFVNTLGFSESERWAAGGQTVHGQVSFGSGAKAAYVSLGSIASSQDTTHYDSGEFGQNLTRGPLGNGVLLYFRVPNVDKYYAKIQAKGAIVDETPTDQMWGDRTISILTPDGYYMTFATPIKGWKPPAGGDMVLVTPKKARKAAAPKKKAAGKKKR